MPNDEKLVKMYPSRIEIDNYNLGDHEILERGLSVFNKVIFQYSYMAFKYDEDSRVLTIPAGIADGFLNDTFFHDYEFMNYLNYYHEGRKIEFKCINEPRNDIQRESLEFLNTEDSAQKMLALATGMGKTYCVINYLATNSKCGMIIVDQGYIAQQWLNQFLLHSDLKKEEVLIITGMETIKDLIQIEEELLPFKAYIALHGTIRSVLNLDNGEQILDALFYKLGINTKIYDEAHVEWMSINNIDFATNVEETIYLTATPNRSDPIEDKVYGDIFKAVPIFGLDFKENESEKYQNLVLVDINTNPDEGDKVTMKNSYGFNGNAHSDYILTNRERYDYFLEVIEELIKDSQEKGCVKTIIILKKNDMVRKIADDLQEKGYDTGIFTSLIPLKDRGKELEKPFIISTDRSLSKAVDIPGLDSVISTNQYSSDVVSYQLAGRIRPHYDPTKEVYFYDITDRGFPDCVKQRRYRLKGLEMKAKSTDNMDMIY